MGRSCTICGHPQRVAIDRALVDGATYRTIADRYGLSETALKRHKSDHLPGHVAKAQEAAQAADADGLLASVRMLQAKALDLLKKAEAEGDYRTALAGIREARACIELLLEVEGELDRRDVVNIVISPQWIELRAVLFGTLADHPEARLAVAGALASLDAGVEP